MRGEFALEGCQNLADEAVVPVAGERVVGEQQAVQQAVVAQPGVEVASVAAEEVEDGVGGHRSSPLRRLIEQDTVVAGPVGARVRAARAARRAVVAQAGITGWAVAVTALHALRPRLNPLLHYLSEYALGPYGWLMTTAFLALGMGSLALTAALVTGAGAGLVPRSRMGAALVGLWGLGGLVVAAFPTDPPGAPATTGGQVHGWAAAVALGSVVAGMALVSGRFRRDARWRDLAVPGLALSGVALVALAWLGLADAPGLPQRMVVTAALVWLFTVAHRLRVLARAVPGRVTPGAGPARGPVRGVGGTGRVVR